MTDCLTILAVCLASVLAAIVWDLYVQRGRQVGESRVWAWRLVVSCMWLAAALAVVFAACVIASLF